MKPVIIVVLAFVLLISLSVFAQDVLQCPRGTYHGIDLFRFNDGSRPLTT